MRFLALFGFLFMAACGVNNSVSSLNSLTDEFYTGKKYYFGFGANGNGNSSMDNEVKYDVLHTHNVFTSGLGGDYLGTKLIEDEADESSIKSEWERLNGLMTAEDMYFQYSSSHGSSSGLGVGVSYDEIRDATLAMPAQEIIVFTMACLSGNLVDSFNEKRDVWEPWAMRRTLFVMASSRSDENSSTGPGRDPDEPNGPSGSAGSAFGHAVWKAIIGYADKDGNKLLSLGEVRDYVVVSTQEEGGHTPVFTGVYDPSLIMAKVPSRDEIEQMLGNTDEGRVQLEQIRKDLF